MRRIKIPFLLVALVLLIGCAAFQSQTRKTENALNAARDGFNAAIEILKTRPDYATAYKPTADKIYPVLVEAYEINRTVNKGGDPTDEIRAVIAEITATGLVPSDQLALVNNLSGLVPVIELMITNFKTMGGLK